MSNESENKKPPLGVMPKYIWNKQRRIDLLQAMLRYEEAGEFPLPDWYNELCDLYEDIWDDMNKAAKQLPFTEVDDE